MEYIGPYQINNILGQGSFGKVYEVTNQHDTIYAIKTETINQIKPMLHLQHQLLQVLHKYSQSGYSFPKSYKYVQQTHFAYIVMDRLSITLQKRVNELNNELSKDALLRVMFNSLKLIEHVHQTGYVIRDVKPSNFMFKKTQNSNEYDDKLYAIDFGLCKKYTNSEGKQHITFKQGKKMIGTPLFCSRRAHSGLQLSRRDDLQSWVYTNAYLVVRLPWEKTKHQKQPQSYSPLKHQPITTSISQTISELKNQQNIQTMLNNNKLPKCLNKIMKQVELLKFDQQPNYEYMYGLMQMEYSKVMDGDALLSKSSCSLNCQYQDKQVKNIKINFKIGKQTKNQ